MESRKLGYNYIIKYITLTDLNIVEHYNSLCCVNTVLLSTLTKIPIELIVYYQDNLYKL